MSIIRVVDCCDCACIALSLWRRRARQAAGYSAVSTDRGRIIVDGVANKLQDKAEKQFVTNKR